MLGMDKAVDRLTTSDTKQRNSSYCHRLRCRWNDVLYGVVFYVSYVEGAYE